MLCCDVAGFFKSILQEEEEEEDFYFIFFFWWGVFFHWKRASANCVAGKQQHDCSSVSPDVEALSWLSVALSLFGFIGRSWAESMWCSTVSSLHLTFPLSHTYTQYTVHSTEINNYHSLTVIALLYAQMEVLYQSSLWHIVGWLVVARSRPVQSIGGVCRGEAGRWCAGASFQVKVIDTALVLLSYINGRG